MAFLFQHLKFENIWSFKIQSAVVNSIASVVPRKLKKSMM
jgi:hypothetical protein